MSGKFGQGLHFRFFRAPGFCNTNRRIRMPQGTFQITRGTDFLGRWAGHNFDSRHPPPGVQRLRGVHGPRVQSASFGQFDNSIN